MSASYIRTRRRLLGGLSLVLAPVAYLIGWVILLPYAEDQRQDGSLLESIAADASIWINAHTFFIIGTLLYVPAIAALRTMLRPQQPVLADIGVGLCAFGLLGITGQIGLNFFWVTVDLDITQLTPSQNVGLFRTAPFTAIPYYTLSNLMFGAGLLFFAQALRKLGLLSTAFAVLIALAVFSYPVLRLLLEVHHIVLIAIISFAMLTAGQLGCMLQVFTQTAEPKNGVDASAPSPEV